jgi:hypothetical protein
MEKQFTRQRTSAPSPLALFDTCSITTPVEVCCRRRASSRRKAVEGYSSPRRTALIRAGVATSAERSNWIEPGCWREVMHNLLSVPINDISGPFVPFYPVRVQLCRADLPRLLFETVVSLPRRLRWGGGIIPGRAGHCRRTMARETEAPLAAPGPCPGSSTSSTRGPSRRTAFQQ